MDDKRLEAIVEIARRAWHECGGRRASSACMAWVGWAEFGIEERPSESTCDDVLETCDVLMDGDVSGYPRDLLMLWSEMLSVEEVQRVA